jgi:hypothetical protein
MNTRSETMTPEFAARELLHSLHIHCVPTPMEEICARLGVLVERTGEIDAEALLIADGAGEVIILLNETIRSVGRVNFTLAHELGHLRLPHHGGALARILKESGRLQDFAVNPQSFMTESAKMINRALIIDGIKYEPIPGQCYEMRLFEEKEVEEYLSRLYEVQSQDDQTPYSYIAFDSSVEEDVAKLPRWFKVARRLATTTQTGRWSWRIRRSCTWFGRRRAAGIATSAVKARIKRWIAARLILLRWA